MNDNFSRFKETEIQNKNELLFSLRSLYNEYIADDSITQSKKFLLENFIKRIEATMLPNCDGWWFYSYEFTRFGMTLNMCHCAELIFESEDTFKMVVDESLPIAEVTCKMMTVAEYAELHRVQPVAVRQWIRRGKLRLIKKQRRDWLIASIAEKPTRNYKPVTYSWDSIDREMYKNFPFLKGVDIIRISQSLEDKSTFVVKYGINSEARINAVDCEKLELALLAMNDIRVDEE